MTSAPSREADLTWACSLVTEWLRLAMLEDIGSVRRTALDHFEQFVVPAAVLDATTARHENAAWRRLFPDGSPPWARSAVESIISRGSINLVPTEGPEVLVAIAAPVSNEVVVVVCAEAIDDALARALEHEWTPRIWSGSIGTPAAADYFNESMRTFAGSRVGPAYRALIYAGDLATWDQAAAQLDRSPVVDVRLLRADGQYRWHRLRVVIMGRRWVAIASECHDVHALEVERDELLDRLRSAQEDAEQAQRLKDQVLAAVSHELRAPVTTIMLWERVLRDPKADETARLQALDAIHQSAVAQSRIVGDLLDMSRAISGKLYVDFRWVEIGRVLGAAIEGALPAALAKRISLTHEGPTFTGEITGDAARLRQVIDNLLSNAIKFTDPGGRVSATIERTGRLVMIKVEDSGRGIAVDALNRIFEPFSQGESLVARREGGLGLGLTIAKQIVELHHGSLMAFSAGPGSGARFTLTLPIAGQSRSPTPPVGVAPELALKGVRALVIDDDERVCNALALLLTRAGGIVDRADSAATARKRMVRRDPHVIICDIAMPIEDGYDFIRSVRASGNQIPAIALTAHATQADAERAMAAGFDLHIAKPVDIQRLVASVTRLIESRRSV